MAWHRSGESVCTLLSCIVGLGKHAQSQTSENELKIPSIIGLQELLNCSTFRRLSLQNHKCVVSVALRVVHILIRTHDFTVEI